MVSPPSPTLSLLNHRVVKEYRELCWRLSATSKIIKSFILLRLTILWFVFLCHLTCMNSTPEDKERILKALPDTDEFSFRQVDSKVSKVMQNRKLFEKIKTGASKPQREVGSSPLCGSIERERSESTLCIWTSWTPQSPV